MFRVLATRLSRICNQRSLIEDRREPSGSLFYDRSKSFPKTFPKIPPQNWLKIILLFDLQRASLYPGHRCIYPSSFSICGPVTSEYLGPAPGITVLKEISVRGRLGRFLHPMQDNFCSRAFLNVEVRVFVDT